LEKKILTQSLNSLSTRSLLPLAAVCHRWRAIVRRLHHTRLIIASTRLRMRNHELLLDSYHPIDRLTTPSVFCEYIGTYGLSAAGAHADMVAIHRLYSRFRPYFRGEYGPPLGEVLSHDIHLDEDELFSQLCIVLNVIQDGPRRGLFASSAPVCDLVVRIRRDYLRGEAAASVTREQQQGSSNSDNASIIWIDHSQKVGLRFRVIEIQDDSLRTSVHDNEDPPVSYRLEYQGTFTKGY
jgi:hypothetical protein